MKLAAYLRKNSLSPAAFARATGISRACVSRFLTDKEDQRRTPSLNLAQRIKEATDGAVALEDWPTSTKRNPHRVDKP